MRTLLLVLLLANAGYFAWARYLSGSDPGTDPQPLSRQLEAHKLKLVPVDGAAPVASGSAPSPAPVAPPEPVATRPPALACVEWGAFAPAEVADVERRLAPLALGARLGQRRAQEQAGWWVFMPPQGSRQNAQKKAAELKGLGVEEYFVVQEEGPTRWAISLGVFRSQEAAKARFEDLQKKKVRSAQIGPRETQVAKVWLQVREVDPATRDRLRELASGAPGSELRDCPAS